jgi:hypothetical protein
VSIGEKYEKTVENVTKFSSKSLIVSNSWCVSNEKRKLVRPKKKKELKKKFQKKIKNKKNLLPMNII